MNSPDRLGKSYEIRGKLAAWTAAAGVLAVGAAKLDIVTPADAAIERTDSLEAKGARTYISELDKKLLSLTSAIKKSDSVKYFKGPPIKTRPETQNYADYYYIMVPNTRNPKHQDTLGIATGKNLKMPIEITMYIDYYREKGKSHWSEMYTIDHEDANQRFSQNEINIFKESGRLPQYFRVGTQKSPLPKEVEYQDNSQAVISQFNNFFKKADSILKRSA